MQVRPDILWIVTTQWRAQACGYAGDLNASTPHLDALAAQSVNYSQAVTPHPFGPFARAALLTGLPSPANGVCDYYDPLPASSRTIAHELRDRGYTTAFFGKWHLAARDRHAPLVGEAHARTIVPPEGRGGFEFWEGFESGFQLNDPWLQGSRLAVPAKFEGYQSRVVTERASAWLHGSLAADTRPPKPWFAMVSLEPPHPPYDAPADGIASRNPASVELPANVPRGGESEERARRELAGYYAHIEATDRAVGDLIAAIDRAAVTAGRSPAIVVFTSVHGDMHGAHGLFRKGWPYEESIRVPLLVRHPANPTGRHSSAVFSLLELPRLTLAWAAGESLQIDREFAVISMPSVVRLPHQCDRVWRGVRTRRRKLVINGDGAPWLFFDLERDPLELTNLAGDPKRASEMAELARNL